MNSPLELLQSYRSRAATKLSSDLASFARRAWRELRPEPLAWNWHHDLVCEYLTLCRAGKIRRLVVNIPPRSTKSMLVSVLFPSWCWTSDPSLSFITASYSEALSVDMNLRRRNLMTGAWYQRMWPNMVQFAPDQNQKALYENTRHGLALACGAGGAVLGRGGDFLILDDFQDPGQANSSVERANSLRTFNDTFRSRFNTPAEGCIIVVQQRLHENDVSGHLLEQEPGEWVHVRVPMIADRDEVITFPISGRVIKRKDGDLLQPSRFTAKWCEQMRVCLGGAVWAGQYLQRPAPAGGAILKPSELVREQGPAPKMERTIISLDTAYSANTSADYSAAVVIGVHQKRYHILNVWRDRAEFPKLKRATVGLAEMYPGATVVIEPKASGLSLLQELRAGTGLVVVSHPISGDKIQRAHSIAPLFESHRLMVPEVAPWMADFEHECEMFPAGRHDDQVDALTLGLDYLRTRGAVPSVVEFWERSAERDNLKKYGRSDVPRPAVCPARPSDGQHVFVDGVCTDCGRSIDYRPPA
jgi:predicted phage terminase large subunit-like protein